MPLILWAHSVTFFWAPASLPHGVTCIITGNNFLFFLKLAASFFATHSQTSSSTPTPEILSTGFIYLVIRRAHWLTREAIGRRRGRNWTTSGRNKLPTTEILTFFCIFCLNFCSVSNILYENKFQYFMRVNFLSLDFSRAPGNFTYWIKS